MEKEGCIPKQFASFEKKRGKEEATEKTEGEAAKKQEKRSGRNGDKNRK